MEVKSFVKEVIARLEGDDTKVVAEKNYRLANAAVKGQLSTLEGDKVKAEIKVENAEDELKRCKYPTEIIQEGSNYIRRIAANFETLESRKEDLEQIEDSIKFYTELLKEINA